MPNASLFASSEKCYQPGKSLSPPLHPHCEKKGEKVGGGDMMKDTQGRTLTADQPTLYLHCTGERTRKKGSYPASRDAAAAAVVDEAERSTLAWHAECYT